MNPIRSLAAGLAAAMCLWPVAAAAQSTGPTVEQVRAVYASAGFQVDSALTWDWTSPPVSTFRVHDASQGRELMVLVYPDPAAAQLADTALGCASAPEVRALVAGNAAG